MCEILDRIETRGFKKGEASGFKKGEVSGFKKGEASGFKNGELQEKRRSALKLLNEKHWTNIGQSKRSRSFMRSTWWTLKFGSTKQRKNSKRNSSSQLIIFRLCYAIGNDKNLY